MVLYGREIGGSASRLCQGSDYVRFELGSIWKAYCNSADAFAELNIVRHTLCTGDMPARRCRDG